MTVGVEQCQAFVYLGKIELCEQRFLALARLSEDAQRRGR